jgi:hypothetical protein
MWKYFILHHTAKKYVKRQRKHLTKETLKENKVVEFVS